MSVFEAVIGWLAPAQCVICGSEGLALCELCVMAEILPYGSRCAFCGQISDNCRTCNSCKRGGAPRYVFVSTDYDGAAKSLLQAYKFGHLRASASPLGQIMADSLLQFNSDSDLSKEKYLIIPVPTATSRLRVRGFDHATLLAKQIAGLADLDFYPALARLGQSRQVGAKREVRLKQTANSYIALRSDKIAGRNVLIVDDVLTTGGTLRAVYKSLRLAGAKHVDALVFAKRL